MSAKKKSVLKRRTSGPMDKFCKKILVTEGSHSPRTVEKPCDKMATSAGSTTPLKPQGSAPVPCRLLKKQDAEAHETHSIEWCCNNKNPTMLTCNQPGTVEELLRRSSEFRQIAEKNKHRELVILREGKAISSHFPCSLIKYEQRLILKYVKAVNNPKTNENRGQRKAPSDKLVTFNLLTIGGKKVMKIMKNAKLKTITEEVTVYACKDEKVKQALKRDGRFKDIIFKNCRLSNTSTGLTAEMSNLVDHLDGKTFKIEWCNKSDQSDSQPGSLDPDMMLNECQISDSDGVQDPPQPSSTAESVNDSNPQEKTRDDVTYQIINSKAMLRNMSSQITAVVKEMKTEQGSRLSRIQNLFRVEFGKSAKSCREVKTMKKLMELSNSVCQVRVNGTPNGTGFLLFDKFVLTNGHVVENIYDTSTGGLRERVTVHFSYESVDQTEGGQDSNIAVEDVAGFEYSLDESENKHDWSLLKLSGAPTLPGCLLKHLGLLPLKGGICIIGHPGGSVKRIDPCLIIPSESRSQVLEREYDKNPGTVHLEGSHYSLKPGSFPLVTEHFFENVAQSLNQQRQALTYDTCFHFCSSGSAVFDEHCNVVALHTGGFYYRNARGEGQSVIEYGQPLSVTIGRIIVQLVERGKFDVLQRYLACEYERHNIMMNNLKKLVESRNLTAFENALNNAVVKSDESLTSFFEFLTRSEEPVAMDTD